MREAALEHAKGDWQPEFGMLAPKRSADSARCWPIISPRSASSSVVLNAKPSGSQEERSCSGSSGLISVIVMIVAWSHRRGTVH